MTNREHKKLLRAIRHQQQLRDNKMLAKKIDRAFTRITEGCSNRVVAATSLGSLREKKAQEELPERSNRIYYRDANPLGNKIHAVQKQRGKSIPAYYD